MTQSNRKPPASDYTPGSGEGPAMPTGFLEIPDMVVRIQGEIHFADGSPGMAIDEVMMESEARRIWPGLFRVES